MAKKAKVSSPKTGRRADKEVQVSPDMSKDRGDGSAFALAMDALQQKKESSKMSNSDYLGVPAVSLDPKDFI